MRVTNNMISNQVMANLSRSLSKYMNLQTMMSTGKRINTPSDDPVGTQKSLNYRKTLSEIEQFQSNISTSTTRLSTYEEILNNIRADINDSVEIALNMANDTYDSSARLASADYINDFFESMMSLINSKSEDGDHYIFSGFSSNTKAFQASTYGVEYLGDYGNFQVEIESGVKVRTNLIGADVLLEPLAPIGEEADMNTGIELTTLLSDLNLGEGVDLSTGTFEVTDNNTGNTTTIDVSAATTVGDVITMTNAQLAAAGFTNLSIDIGAEGNNLTWSTVDNGQVTMTTPLKNLNNGNGVDLTNGRFYIHTSDNSINVEVDIRSATTLGDVLTEINSALSAAGVSNVTASLNAAGTGIDLIDINATPLGLRIDELTGSSTTAADLGLTGFVDPVLMGSDLNPLLDFTIDESSTGLTTASDLGIVGNFSYALVGNSLSPNLKVDTSLSLLNGGLGYDWGEIKISQGNSTVVLDLDNPAYTTVQDILDAFNNSGLDIIASINPDQTGIQIATTDNTKSLIIQDVDDSRLTRDMGIFGSSDIMGSMILLEQALRDDDSRTAGELVGILQKGSDHVLTQEGALGAKIDRLDTTSSRLIDLNYNFTVLLSNEEDADLTKLVSDLSLQENNYQAALIAASKIITPSLVDFLV